MNKYLIIFYLVFLSIFCYSEITIDLSGNPGGIYILSICIDGELLHRKLCIE